jgi:opacity protein-like surface antigen
MYARTTHATVTGRMSWRGLSSGLLLGGALTLVAFGAPPSAHAAGVEDSVAGTETLGRAANYGRVRDFFAVLQNPANLALTRREVAGELRLPVLRSCYDRARDPAVTYRQDQEGALLEGFGNTCNDAPPSLTANIGLTIPFEKWGLGIGLFTPAAVGNAQYGRDTIVTLFAPEDEPYPTTTTGTESPTRQMAIERAGATAYLMAGVGVELSSSFRIGASGGIGFGQVYSKNATSSVGGTFQDQEVVNELRLRDRAIPRASASAVWSVARWLELFGVFQYQADLRASGRQTLTANGIRDVPLRSCGQERPGTHCFNEGVTLTVPFPTYEVTGGVRFVKLRPDVLEMRDPLRDEIFDFEVDLNWSQTSHVDSFRLKIHETPSSKPDAPRIQFANTDGSTPSFIRYASGIPKNWRDTWTVRAGTDVNLVRGRLALRVGGSYASEAVDPAYMNLDYWPVRKFSVNAGLTVGAEHFRFHLGYSHIFYQKVVVPVGAGLVPEIATNNEAAADAINEGTFVAAQHVVALQLNASF